MKPELPSVDRSAASEDASSDAEAFAKILAMYQRAVIERGDSLAVLEAMEWCGVCNKPAPSWLAKAFAIRLARFTNFEVRTLDEAFGVARPKSFKLVAARQKLEKLADVVELTDNLRAQGLGAEDARRKIAEELHISVALVKKYQAEAAKQFHPIPPLSTSAADLISSAIAGSLTPAKSQLRKSKKRS